jgi:hypothetical protein
MNWEAAGAIAEILGVIAVIGSLIYVGRQINQNTQIARANIVHETAILSNQIFQLIAQDSELADIYGRGTTGVSLNGVDLQRFTALVTIYMTWLEDIDSQATAGLYFDPPDGESAIEYLSREFSCFFSTPEVRHWWHDSGKVGFHHDFIRKTDRHIDSA